MLEKVQRNSSIELLRIISIMGVIILHYNNAGIGGGFGLVEHNSANYFYLMLSENLSIGAVNVFIIISGFFLSQTQNRRFIKIIDLIIQMVILRVVLYVIPSIVKQEPIDGHTLFIKFLPIDYFIILYSVLYILSPYINILVNHIDKKAFKKLLVTVFVIFAVWSFAVDLLQMSYGPEVSQLSPVSRFGSQCGYSIVQFMLMYLIGAFIAKYKVSFSKKKAWIGIIISFACMYGMSILERSKGFTDSTTWNYNNPIIIIFVSLIFVLVKDISFKNKLINELAKATFTCYIIQWTLIGYFHIDLFVNNNVILLIAHQVLSAAISFLIAYVVYKIYHICSRWLIKLLTPICDKVRV
ncbi:MAG: acyltransferase [Erysipelotrichaceae bacterium]|nr:acyltransferase [Erysipelotrichaceae bacterium]